MQRHLLAGIIMLAALATAVPQSVEAQGRRWNEGYIPNLPVVTHEGKTLRFYDDLIKGKIVVINFIYTSCQDVCPIATARLAQVEEKLGEKVGCDFFFISMTVDPEHDTPERLNEYAKAFGAGPGWLFVTRKPEDVRAINYKLGERSSKLSEHRNEVVLGNDADGQWQRDNLFGDLDRLVTTIHGMDPKWRDEVRTVPNSPLSNTMLKMSNQPGQAMFKKYAPPATRSAWATGWGLICAGSRSVATMPGCRATSKARHGCGRSRILRPWRSPPNIRPCVCRPWDWQRSMPRT